MTVSKGIRRRRHSSIPDVMAHYSIPEPNSGCLLWMGPKEQQGYGALSFKRKVLKTHRIAWELANGPIPAGMCVCHKCDNRLCVEPTHLWLGTQADNQADKIAKGRQARNRHIRGEAVSTARLTDAQVLAIRSDTRKQRVIADDFGIDQSHVSKLRSGQRWGHI